MLGYLIILSVTTVSQNYAAVNVKQELHVRRERDEIQADKYPFLAYVNIGNNSCAGAILSDSWVVTARACGNTTEQEPGWVYAGGRSDANNIQKRRTAHQHSCPDDHRLLLLQLEQPFTFDDAVSAVPIALPGTFSDHEGTCDVITFGAEPSKTSLNTAHAVETRLVAGSECMDSATDTSAVVRSSPAAAPSLDPAHNGTVSKASETAATDQTHTGFDTMSPMISGDAGKKKKRDTRSLEEMAPEIIDAGLLCSSEINEEAASLKHLGSPVVCEGVLIAVVTPKPTNGASREKKEDTKTYYTAIGPDYSWIKEKVPGVRAVSWNEVAKEGRSVRSKAVSSLTGNTRLHKYKMTLNNARRRRLSRLANMIAEVAPDKESSEASKLDFGDELEPQLRLNKIFSVWFPMARRVRGIILLNRMFVRPESDLWGDVAEKAEAALRPLRRVKRSSPEQAGEESNGDARAPPPLMQTWSFQRTKRGDSAPQQQQQQQPCPEASDGRRKRSAGGDASARAPCATEARVSRGTTKLAQRLAAREKLPGTARWRGQGRNTVTAA